MAVNLRSTSTRTISMKFNVVHYWDVWGNPDDGFKVNDVSTLG